MAHDVFLSYSTKDKPTADAVCFGLEAAGIRCWMAPRDIMPGQQWASAIVEAIHASRLMIVVLSTNSNASDQVLREVERSVHKSIPIIPFRIEEFELASAFEYYLSVPHWLDAMTGPLEEHVERLVATARVLIEQRPVPATPATPSPGLTPAAPLASQPDSNLTLVRPPVSNAPPASPPVSNAVASSSTHASTLDLPGARAAALSAEDQELVELVRPLEGNFAPAESASGQNATVVMAATPAAAPVGASGGLESGNGVHAVVAPSLGPAIPIWAWGVGGGVLLLIAVLVGTRWLLPGESGRTTGPTAVIAIEPSPSAPTAAPPATQPPQVASASVQVTSSVDGATILVGGQPAGRTPQTLRLQPGKYDLTLQAATYRDWSQSIEVTEGQDLPVQGILDPLPANDVLEVTDRVMGRNASVDASRIVRIGNPTDTFLVSDVINAVIYFKPKTYQIRDLSYNVAHRWQIAGQSEPGVIAGRSTGPKDEPLLFTHACALAAQLDARGSNTPLTLEVQVEGETIARFTFRISGGSLADAPRDPVAACDRSKLPNVVVAAPNLTTIDIL